MILYLIRHGETTWNRREIFRGRADVPLTRKGHSEAEATARALRKRPISAIYSSPLSRAMDTARPLARARGLEVQPRPGIIDVDFGRWQGIAKKKVAGSHPRLYQRWLTRPEGITFPGGESLARVRTRSVRCLRGVTRSHPDGEIALVSHRVVLKVLMLSLMGLPNSRFWDILLDPASISAFVFRPGEKPKLKLLNDVCHLKRLPGYREVRDF